MFTLNRFVLSVCVLLIPLQALAVQSTPAAKPKAEAAKKEPAKAVPKTYPSDVKEAFLKSCVGFHKELIPSCKCMILTFERMVPYDQFEALLALQEPTEDPRFTKVAGACLKAQQQQ